MLIAVLGFGSGLLNIIPLAALIGVMITVSIATFDWDSLRSLKDQSPLEILTTLLTVVIVVATNKRQVWRCIMQAVLLQRSL